MSANRNPLCIVGIYSFSVHAFCYVKHMSRQPEALSVLSCENINTKYYQQVILVFAVSDGDQPSELLKDVIPEPPKKLANALDEVMDEVEKAESDKVEVAESLGRAAKVIKNTEALVSNTENQ